MDRLCTFTEEAQDLSCAATGLHRTTQARASPMRGAPIVVVDDARGTAIDLVAPSERVDTSVMHHLVRFGSGSSASRSTRTPAIASTYRQSNETNAAPITWERPRVSIDVIEERQPGSPRPIARPQRERWYDRMQPQPIS
jgi:hypothetical protein